MLCKVTAPSNEEGDVTGTIAPAKPLTAVDRCDRCGAQAYVRVTLTNGGELLFCAHHMRRYGEELRKVAAEIHDETERLHESTTAGAPEDER